ncbi:hypothetical protein [Streptosporangium sp. H16]|uniref:hypothetical protein n=1 Tax=Streptosporangium sp. H16 TaxID=3444184 RepID=UPI003F78C996
MAEAAGLSVEALGEEFDGKRQGVEDPAVLRRFRTYLHRMVHRVAALPGLPPLP